MPVSTTPPDLPIGILCAMPEERQVLLDAIDSRRDVGHVAFTADSGVLDGYPVVLAEAGVGKVQAAVSATILLERHGCRSLLVSGIAGGISASARIGDLVVADRVIDIDYGRRTDDELIVYQPGALPFPHLRPDPGYLLEPGLRARVAARLEANHGARVHLGTVLSGDTFLASARVRDELAQKWAAMAIEMEGAAVCGVAERFGVPWLIVRALSDRAGEDSATDLATFVDRAAADAATLVRTLLPALAEEPALSP